MEPSSWRSSSSRARRPRRWPASLGGAGAPASSTAASYRFDNGAWFDGKTFRRRTVFAVGGVLASKAPAALGGVVDLKSGYVVPPFGDAHNHYIAGPHDIEKILHQYLADGIFHAKNPASKRPVAAAPREGRGTSA